MTRKRATTGRNGQNGRKAPARPARGKGDPGRNGHNGQNEGEARRAKLKAAIAALLELDAEAHAMAAHMALLLRAGGADPELRRAALLATRAAQGLEVDPEDGDKPARLAAVMRGGTVARMGDPSQLLRDLATWIAANERHGLGADMLARLLDAWRPPEARRRVPTIDPQAVAAALGRPKRTGRVADVALACGVLEVDSIGGRQAALDVTSKALKSL